MSFSRIVGRYAALDLDFSQMRADSGKIERLLNVHAVFHGVAQNPGLAHRLIVLAHHAKADRGLAVPRRQARHDGVRGASVRRKAVGMAGLEGEAQSPVLQKHA